MQNLKVSLVVSLIVRLVGLKLPTMRFLSRSNSITHQFFEKEIDENNIIPVSVLTKQKEKDTLVINIYSDNYHCLTWIKNFIQD